jgi:hypothetical protein
MVISTIPMPNSHLSSFLINFYTTTKLQKKKLDFNNICTQIFENKFTLHTALSLFHFQKISFYITTSNILQPVQQMYNAVKANLVSMQNFGFNLQP